MAKKDNRHRNFEFIVYPESCPSNWIKILDDQHLCFVVSPLHDRDVFEDSGELKKPHWHCIVAFSGNKSDDQIQLMADELNCEWSRVKEMKGAVPYLIHKNHPEKAQYDIRDIKCFGGFNIDPFFEVTKSERYTYIAEMVDWIKENDIKTFRQLFEYARFTHYNTWFKCLCDDSAYIMTMYIKNECEQNSGMV